MKKKADPMFRKAHLKLFSVITSILLAVFIALLGSVNIITKEVMEHQSEYVLKQIAASIEYNDTDNYFTLSRPDEPEPRKNDAWNSDIWNDIWKYYMTEDPNNQQSGLLWETTASVTSSSAVTSTTAVGGNPAVTAEPPREDERRVNQQPNNNIPQQNAPSETVTTAPVNEATTGGTQVNPWEEWFKQFGGDPNQWQQGGWGQGTAGRLGTARTAGRLGTARSAESAGTAGATRSARRLGSDPVAASCGNCAACTGLEQKSAAQSGLGKRSESGTAAAVGMAVGICSVRRS